MAISFSKFAVYIMRTLFGMLVALVLIIWLLGTESALQWGARHAVQWSNGKLALIAVHGSFVQGQLRIESLSFQTKDTRYEAKELNVDWTPAALLKWHLKVNRFTLQELKVITLNSSTTAAQLPTTLHLPVTLSAPSIKIKRIVLKDGETEQELNNIDLGLENSGDHYKLTLRNIDSEWGQGEANLALGDTRPFNITAHAALQQTDDWIHRTEADVSGNLSELLLKATLHVPGGQAQGEATLTPFEKIPVALARIIAKGINPARLHKGLPQAELGTEISLTQQGSNGLQGNITIRNNMPGTLDQSRLPLREMSLQFSGVADQLDLRGIHLDLDKAGDFKGDGQVKNKKLQLSLTTGNFNPRGMHSKMKQMLLAGHIRLQAGQNSQVLTADLHNQNIKLQINARLQDALVELEQATLQSGSGSLALHGSLSLQDAKKFQLAGVLRHFNPADFGDYPSAGVNATLSAAGHLTGEPQAAVSFNIADSSFMQQPLTGQGKLNVSATRIWNSAIKLQLAHNHAELAGGMGTPGDHLDFNLDVDNLAMFDPDLTGKILATATLQGSFSAPSGHFNAKINELSWRKQYRVTSLQASGRLDQNRDGALELDVALQDLVTPQLRLESASLHGQGTRAKHTLQLNVKNAEYDIESRVTGGWQGTSGWVGQLTELTNRGVYAFALKAAAKLELGTQHFLLGNASIDSDDANLTLHEISYKAGKIASSGELNGLSLDYLQRYTEPENRLKTDLRLAGNWNFTLSDTINGHVALWRERGDVTLPTYPPTALGLQQLTLQLDAKKNQVQGRLEAAGDKLGNLKLDARGLLSRRHGVWGIAGDAPVSANADLAIESLAWLAPLLDNSGALAFDGALKAKLHAGGTLAQPTLAGTLSGQRFSIVLRNQGLRFTDGSFQAELRDQALLLHQLTLHGGDGTLKGSGSLALENKSPVMQLSLIADKLEILSRPDRQLILSGTGDASATGKKLQIAARLKADYGLIELPKGDEPSASDDVIVLNKTQTTEKKAQPYDVNIDLDLALGERFYVKGHGFDAQLGGSVKLNSKNGAMPTAYGSIRVVRGTYSAYGQRLAIERGILNFQGPVDNPGLDIIALRKHLAVEAGVAVTGTIQSPRVKLVSTPDVPDSDKLSWLVLGYGIDDSSGKDFSVLQVAAGALLSAGDSITLQQKIAQTSGFEDVSLKGSGELEGTVLSLGKRISARAYLSYEQGLSGATSLVKINYTLTKRISVQAQAGTTPAIDLFYTFKFE